MTKKDVEVLISAGMSNAELIQASILIQLIELNGKFKAPIKEVKKVDKASTVTKSRSATKGRG